MFVSFLYLESVFASTTASYCVTMHFTEHFESANRELFVVDIFFTASYQPSYDFFFCLKILSLRAYLLTQWQKTGVHMHNHRFCACVKHRQHQSRYRETTAKKLGELFKISNCFCKDHNNSAQNITALSF